MWSTGCINVWRGSRRDVKPGSMRLSCSRCEMTRSFIVYHNVEPEVAMHV